MVASAATCVRANPEGEGNPPPAQPQGGLRGHVCGRVGCQAAHQLLLETLSHWHAQLPGLRETCMFFALLSLPCLTSHGPYPVGRDHPAHHGCDGGEMGWRR